MRIRYVIDARLTQPVASTNHALGICQGFVRAGHALELVHFSPKAGMYGELDEREVALPYPSIRGGIRIAKRLLALWISTYADPIEYPASLPKRALVKHARMESRFTPDIWYFRIVPSEAHVRAVSKIRLPKVLEINGAEILNVGAGTELCRAMDLLLVGSDRMKELIAARTGVPPARIAVHHNAAMDVEAMESLDKEVARARLGIACSKPVVLYVSYFGPYHDTETIESTIQNLLKTRGDLPFTFVVVGGGTGYARWRALFDAQIRAGTIVMPGVVEHRALATYISAADVCLNLFKTTKLKTEGNLHAQKLYDYIACGRPTIEAVDFEDELPAWGERWLKLIPPGDACALEEALMEVLGDLDSWERRAAYARAYLLKHRTWDAAARLTLSYMEALLPRGAGDAAMVADR